MIVDSDQLEKWSCFAVQALQDFCDEAQIAAGDPDGENELQDIRDLIKDLDDIVKPDWLSEIAKRGDDETHKIKI